MNDQGRLLAIYSCLLAASGCRAATSFGDAFATESGGDAGDTDTDTDGTDTDDSDTNGGDASCVNVGPRMMRRLTSAQLEATLEAIFADPNVPAGQVLTDPVVEGFKVDAREAVIRDLGAQQVMQYAETVADWAVTNKLDSMVPCQSMDAACQDQIIQELGTKFHREPLTESMVEAYRGIMASEENFEDGVRQLVAAFVQSPYFLYRRELGDPDPDAPDRFRLTDYELASNLSYSLTGGPPDAALLELAAQGLLRDEDQLLAEVSRLVQSTGGQDNLVAFVEGWLEIEDLPSTVRVEDPAVEFDDALRHDMLEETGQLFLHVFNEGGDVEELLTADYSFVNDRLGALYGMDGASSPEHQQVELPLTGQGARAPGVLGHSSVLTRHALVDNSSPVARGVIVRERILCQSLPAPPVDVDTDVPPAAEGTTNRQRYEAHTGDPQCASCHNLIDPIGFSFEHYDQYGRWRAEEGGAPIDASGELAGLDGDPVTLDGLESLAEALAQSPEADACFAHYLTYYTYGVEGCAPEDIIQSAGGEDATLMSTLEAIVRSAHFRERVLGE